MISVSAPPRRAADVEVPRSGVYSTRHVGGVCGEGAGGASHIYVAAARNVRAARTVARWCSRVLIDVRAGKGRAVSRHFLVRRLAIAIIVWSVGFAGFPTLVAEAAGS